MMSITVVQAVRLPMSRPMASLVTHEVHAAEIGPSLLHREAWRDAVLPRCRPGLRQSLPKIADQSKSAANKGNDVVFSPVSVRGTYTGG
jgi:hypothetical protein